MTNNAFLQTIRAYEALARRYGRSFSEAVNALMAARHSTIAASAMSDDEKHQAVDDMHAAVQREYGSADRDFTISYIPF